MKYYYSILGVDPACAMREIRAAYRRLAKKYHPDLGGDPTRFHDIRSAYEVLSDPDRRKEYDERMAELPFGGAHYKTVIPKVVSEPVDVFDDAVDVLARRFGMGAKKRIKADIILDEHEAREGINLQLQLPSEMICHRCFGFGGTIISACRVCGGTGMITGNKTAFMVIPSGVREGDVIVSRSSKIEVVGRIIIAK
jgi:DnaJ-class molecular chaperone